MNPIRTVTAAPASPQRRLGPVVGIADAPTLSLQEAVRHDPVLAKAADLGINVQVALSNTAAAAAGGDENTADAHLQMDAALHLYTQTSKVAEEVDARLSQLHQERGDHRRVESLLPLLRLVCGGIARLPRRREVVYHAMTFDGRSRANLHYLDVVEGKTIINWAPSICTTNVDELRSPSFLGKSHMGRLLILCIDASDVVDISSCAATGRNTSTLRLLLPGIVLEVLSHHRVGRAVWLGHVKQKRGTPWLVDAFAHLPRAESVDDVLPAPSDLASCVDQLKSTFSATKAPTPTTTAEVLALRVLKQESYDLGDFTPEVVAEALQLVRPTSRLRFDASLLFCAQRVAELYPQLRERIDLHEYIGHCASVVADMAVTGDRQVKDTFAEPAMRDALMVMAPRCIGSNGVRWFACAVACIALGDSQTTKIAYSTPLVRETLITLVSRVSSADAARWVAGAIGNIASTTDRTASETFCTVPLRNALVLLAARVTTAVAVQWWAKAVYMVTTGCRQSDMAADELGTVAVREVLDDLDHFATTAESRSWLEKASVAVTDRNGS